MREVVISLKPRRAERAPIGTSSPGLPITALCPCLTPGEGVVVRFQRVVAVLRSELARARVWRRAARVRSGKLVMPQ